MSGHPEEPWDLPNSWIWASFSDVADIAQNLVNPADVPDMPHIAPDSIASGSRELLEFRSVKEDGVISPKQRFFPGQILFTKIRPYLLKSVHATFDGVCSADMYPLWPRETMDTDYLLFWLTSADFRDLIAHSQGRTVLPKINQPTLNRTSIPLPPLPEQRRIVAKIDSLSTKSKRARDHLDHIPRLVEKYKQAILAAAFRSVSENDALRPLDEVAAVITSGSRDWSQYYNRGNAVFVLAGNVRPLAFDPEPRRYVDPPLDGPDAKRSRILKNDLLVTIVGAGTGELCRVPEDFEHYYVCQSVALVRLREPAKSRFLELFLNTDEYGAAQIRTAIYGQGRPHLSFVDLKGLKVPDPDQDTVNKIVRRISSAFAWIDRLASQAKSARALIGHLDQAILAKAFCGELVPQDPADEPAGVLLERIRAGRSAAAAAPALARRPRRGAQEATES
jgi:type I restriction enzyme, S subunit